MEKEPQTKISVFVSVIYFTLPQFYMVTKVQFTLGRKQKQRQEFPLTLTFMASCELTFTGEKQPP